ncbi:Sjogren's syndrome/scleroderma autoantigen 1 family protein [Halorussus salinus]|uniref:Sjogren's syndrome/scleroderma autoantigen 1 family protein n=1 Tax=Halorussus salinus TaxID=1364935 RepID=UPI0010923C32|nr:Sjogren's syndrome/scleroderma autoantigen 1 family protein [Halorussus salinus]
MSSDDDSGFDKEAEREKLREKYGDDEKDRENTRRMSELLLQGATMTGKHCDNCGDPIFRYDGQEFCPTCQHEAKQAQQAQSAETQQAQNGGTQQAQNGEAQRTQGGEPRQPRSARTEETDGPDGRTAGRAASDGDAANADAETDRPTDHGDDEPRVEINDVRVADRHADRSDVRAPPSQSENRGSRSESGGRGHDRTRASDRSADRTQGRRGGHDHGETHQHARDAHRPATGPSDRDATARTAADSGDLGPAREALVRKLSDLARRAEETDDVTRARELLGATREAAEALAALDRANR